MKSVNFPGTETLGKAHKALENERLTGHRKLFVRGYTAAT